MMEPHLNVHRVKADERKYFGRTVMATLRQLGAAASQYEVIRCVANVTGQPEVVVQNGVIQSLLRGTRMGFFVRSGNKFAVPSTSID